MKTETRKEEIIKTAAKLFKERGYSAVTMRDLATDMGIKAASLYNHIDSKQQILKVIIMSIAKDFTEGMHAIMKAESSSISKLKKVVALHVKITANNTNDMASLNNDWMHLEEHLEHYLKLRNEYETSVLRIIEMGIANSEIKNTNPEIVMFSMLTTLRSLYLWIPKKEDLDAEDLVLSLNQVLIEGINI